MAANLPIKSIEEINLIKDFYRKKGKIRDLLMFVISINTGISLVDLLNLRVRDVKNKLYMTYERKKSVPLNEEILELIPQVIEKQHSSTFLFRNQQGKKINRTGVFHAFKNVCRELGLNDKYSVLSWRKTFAYHYYIKYKDLSYLMWLFNQHEPKVALKFIDMEENMNLRYRGGVCL